MAFQPGQSGNPKGRRQEKPFADALRMELLAAGEDHKALRLVARKLIQCAQDGDGWAVKELLDRTDGKVPQGIIGGGEDDAPFLVSVIERRIVRANPRD